MRKCISSGSYLEPEIGFSRAVRIENVIAFSGTAPIAEAGGTVGIGCVYTQTLRCLEIIKNASQEAGASLNNIIRTRVMLTDISSWKDAARAHGEFFSNIQPACTFVEVSGFINPEWLIELEADAIIS